MPAIDPFSSHPSTAPSAGWGGPAPAEPELPSAAPRRLRRRFGAAAIGATLVAGGGAGALATALLSNGGTTTVVETAAASTTAASATIQSIVAKVEPALVDIHTTGTSSSSSAFGNGLNPFGAETTTAAAGTGMIISSDGLILTNAHVLAGATTITVTYDGQTTAHTATLVGEDAAKDIALIKVSGASNLPTVTLAPSSGVQAGDSVLAIGNALDLQTGGFTVSNGIISGLNRAITTDNNESLSGLLQTDAAISSGDSGGALVNAAGEVIGMNTASASSSGTNTAQDIGFAIPSSEITSLIPTLEKGNVGTPTVGTGSTQSSGSSQPALDPNESSGGGGYGYGYEFGSPF